MINLNNRHYKSKERIIPGVLGIGQASVSNMLICSKIRKKMLQKTGETMLPKIHCSGQSQSQIIPFFL